MNSNTRTVTVVMITAVFLIVLGFLSGTSFSLGQDKLTVGMVCAIRSISVISPPNNWAYSGEFEASITDKGKLSGKLDPKQLQTVSDASQQVKEFQKFVVAGFNSCAITKQQYGELGGRFQQLDGLSRRIDGLAAIPNPTGGDKAQLAACRT